VRTSLLFPQFWHWKNYAVCMTMPKAAMNEEDGAVFWQDEVGLAEERDMTAERFCVVKTSMEEKAEN